MESVNDFLDKINHEIKENIDQKFRDKKMEFLSLVKQAEDRRNKFCKNQETCENFEPMKDEN